MKFHTQRLLHLPEQGQQGDCYRTVLACLLDVEPEAVPHFMADPNLPVRKLWRQVDAWLLEHHGLRYIQLPFATDDLDAFLVQTNRVNPGVRFDLTGNSPRGTQHCVIVEDGEIVHDPHPEGGGIVGPGEDGLYWMGFLVPVAVHGVRLLTAKPSSEAA